MRSSPAFSALPYRSALSDDVGDNEVPHSPVPASSTTSSILSPSVISLIPPMYCTHCLLCALLSSIISKR
ncbi:hypothetical protein E2C01_087504 [Portunus trituberculatus]|uniref:Uncharacterized protein n=1 Tax=Portunus trituberculatus TaxID=210409 RepID=A0A5B7JCN1_PORTR|nr:hypothetical protein [Portunus trituberculatus]